MTGIEVFAVVIGSIITIKVINHLIIKLEKRIKNNDSKGE